MFIKNTFWLHVRRYTLSHMCVCVYTYIHIYEPCPKSSGTLRRTWRLKVICVCQGHLGNPPWLISVLATCDAQPSLEHVVVRPGVLVVEVQQRIIFEESRAPAAGVSLHTDGLSRSHGHTVTRSHSLLPHSRSRAQTGPGDGREGAWGEAASADNRPRERLPNPAGSSATAPRETRAAWAKDSARPLSQRLPVQGWCEVTGTSPGNA